MSELKAKIVDTNPEIQSTSKRQKFVNLAEKRTINAIKAIRIIGKLGNRNAYDYDDGDIRKIVKALNDEIEALKNRMNTNKLSTGVEFRL